MGYSVNDLNRGLDKVKEAMDEKSEKRARKLAESIQRTGLFTSFIGFPLIWFGATCAFATVISWFTGGVNSADGGALFLFIIGYPISAIAAFLLIKKNRYIRMNPYVSLVITWIMFFGAVFVESVIH